jgi:SAM-dependent methyltransferase
MKEAGAPRIKAQEIAELLACPACGRQLAGAKDGLVCACGMSYSVKDGRVYFTDTPDGYEESGEGPNVLPEDWGAWRRRNFDYFKDAFTNVPDSASVLDLGAGPGQFSMLTDRFASFVSMDFRAFAPTNVVADLTKPLPVRSASMDLVMASNVLEHIPDTRALLGEIFRVLKPGGHFVATIPFLMRVHQKPYDFNRYTNFQLHALLSAAGFKDVSVCALSRPIEVYETSGRHFFATELARASGVRAFMLRSLRFLDRGRLSLLRALSGHEPSSDYTEGYGLIAIRP